MKNSEKILNLTQHKMTPAQAQAGVVEPTQENKQKIKELLTFNSLPSALEVENRAKKIARIASSYPCKKVMIGGAPFLMSQLGKALRNGYGLSPVFAFSRRDSVEKQINGKVEKTTIFKHIGFVENVA